MTEARRGARHDIGGTGGRQWLVTGAAGFIGARFVEACNRQRIGVVSVDDPGHFRARPEHAGIDFGRIVDRARLESWLGGREAADISAIVHLGARTDTTLLDETFFQRNIVECSQRLWSHAVRARIPLVYASSAATYGDGGLGYDDDESRIDRLRPLNPYGEAKRRFDAWVLARERAGEAPPAWSAFKLFNVYGFGERHKGAMASVVLHAYDQIRQSGGVRLFRSHRPHVAHGHQQRDFILVEDVVAALLFALDQPIRRGIYNLGTGRARTFLDLARAVFTALEGRERIEFVDTPLEIRDRYQYFTEARIEKLRGQGFDRPFTSLEDGIAAYVRRLVGAG